MIMIIPIIHAVMIQYASGCCIAWNSRDCRNDRRVFIPNNCLQKHAKSVACDVSGNSNKRLYSHVFPPEDTLNWCIDSGMQTKDHFQQRSDAGLLPGSVSKISEIPVWYMSTMHPKITESVNPFWNPLSCVRIYDLSPGNPELLSGATRRWIFKILNWSQVTYSINILSNNTEEQSLKCLNQQDGPPWSRCNAAVEDLHLLMAKANSSNDPSSKQKTHVIGRTMNKIAWRSSCNITVFDLHKRSGGSS